MVTKQTIDRQTVGQTNSPSAVGPDSLIILNCSQAMMRRIVVRHRLTLFGQQDPVISLQERPRFPETIVGLGLDQTCGQKESTKS